MSNPSREGCAVIEDGYTRQAYLAGVPFTSPAVRFSYRPLLITPLTKLRREIAKSDAETIVSIQSRTIVKCLVDWDVKDAKGDPVKLDVESLKKIDPFIFDGVSAIVLGLRQTDVDPQWNQQDAEAESKSIDDIFDPVQSEIDDVKN